ncbi:terminase large subunit [Gordonia phage Sour]|uniref:Terminase n=1 Tax=Gordonia phage Sour TaxID=2182349 RepID=A0A2U8UKH6_9CAUD|nr:terminase large subunit [Gordonia phage Sour]AWN04209.1 terminase [Gordonia phage Sour]
MPPGRPRPKSVGLDGEGDPSPFPIELLDASGTVMPEAVERIYTDARSWPPEQKQAFLEWMKSAKRRESLKRQYSSPADLASAVIPGFVQTPAVKLISAAIERALREPGRNLMITMSPQEGKSTLAAVVTPVRALQLNPHTKIILATYGDELASEHSIAARTIIETNGAGVTDQLTGAVIEDRIGLSIKRGKGRINSWGVAEGRGGLVAVGLNSSVTGRPADLLIIDDPYKGPTEADSVAHRKKVSDWMRSVAMTRLSPQASIILIQTRWHPNDLAGEILAAEQELPPAERTWKHINIPAIAEEGIKDSLGREPGTPMISARDTPEVKRDFVATRRKVGERVWYALYQGAPAPPSGGMFDRAWFDPPELELPEHPVATVVAIDPADSGKGDETGILGGVLAQDGRVIFTEDWSGTYTSDQWGKRAVRLALEIEAREIALEAYSAAQTYINVLAAALRDIRAEARRKVKREVPLAEWERRSLLQLPFVVHRWTGKGDAVARSALLRQSLETKRTAVLEHRLAVFVDQAVLWQPGQHQPDRVAAGVILHDRLSKLSSSTTSFADPVNTRPTEAPAWMRRKIGG